MWILLCLVRHTIGNGLIDQLVMLSGAEATDWGDVRDRVDKIKIDQTVEHDVNKYTERGSSIVRAMPTMRNTESNSIQNEALPRGWGRDDVGPVVNRTSGKQVRTLTVPALETFTTGNTTVKFPFQVQES